METSLRTPKDQVERFLEDTADARAASQKCRDYFDHRQWTEHEKSKLRERKQAPIVVNRIKPKVEGLLGVYELRKSDPKAFPRTKKHEKAAHAITDALRYVADNTNFDMTRLDVAEDFFVEGYGGVIVDVTPKKDQLEIDVKQIPWDRIYFDPSSRRKDFKDATFMGVLLWMYIDQVEDFLGVKVDKDQLQSEMETMDSEGTTDDRPRWANKKADRVRIAMHFELVKGVWKMVVFSGEYIIVKMKDSPYLDEDGLPMNPIELVSANVDRDNNRYGEVLGFLSQQDELNHRRSKFLHLNSVRQTYGNDNAIQDVGAAKKELRNPEGHVKINGDAKFGEDFGVIPTGDFSRAQFELYQDAKQEMDRSSFNAPLGGDTGGRELSGKAIDKLQQGGTLELNRQYAILASFEKRVYTQIWARVKQFWNEEKWIRVTDDQDNLRWVGLNSKITAQQHLMEMSENESLPLDQRRKHLELLQFLIQTKNPRLNEVVEIQNDTSEIDIDIIIDQSFDVVNVQQEQFQLLAQFGQDSGIDIIELLELSQIRGKDDLIAKIERRRAQQAEAEKPMQERTQQIMEASQIAKIEKTKAETGKTAADAQKKKVEAVTDQIKNTILVNSPMDKEPQVNA